MLIVICLSNCFFFVVIPAMSSIMAELMLRSAGLIAAINLHKSLLCGILHAPIIFFDQTPSGRILSRFSKDIDVLDITLPESLKWLLYCAAEVILLFTQSINRNQNNQSRKKKFTPLFEWFMFCTHEKKVTKNVVWS